MRPYAIVKVMAKSLPGCGCNASKLCLIKLSDVTHSRKYLITPKKLRLKMMRKNACKQNESNEVIR